MLNGMIPETCEEYVVQRVRDLEQKLQDKKQLIKNYENDLERYHKIFEIVEKDLQIDTWGSGYRVVLDGPCSNYAREKEHYDWYKHVFSLEEPEKEEKKEGVE